MQNAAKWPQINAERSFSREWAHSLENEQFDAELMRNATERPQINAERSKFTENLCRMQQTDTELMQNAHSLENELFL